MQRDNSFGELLFRLRERKGVSQSRLCRGLCSVSALSRYERGERAPHMLLFNALMQRLGASVVSLNAVISIREYHYLSWKGQILQAARENRIRTVQDLLEDPVSPGEVGDCALQEQFLYVMRSFLQERRGKDAESMELLKKAASLTVPVDRVPFRELLLSAGETFILVKLSDLLVKNGEKAQAGKLLWELIGYLERNVEDEMRSILYPQVVRILAPLLLEEGRFSECGQLCRKAIEMLRDTGHLADMEELLSCYLRCDCQGEYAGRCRKWLWTVREIFRRYPVEKNNSIFPCQWEQELYLIQEMIRAYRVMDGLSQEEMSGLLFSPETLSRAENGKHTLHTEHYFAVRERLSVEEEFINPRLHTRDYFILEKMQKVYRAISTTRYEDAKRELAQVRASLEKSGELSDEYNQSVLEMTNVTILSSLKKVGRKEVIASCERFLKCEYPDIFEETFWNRYLSKARAEALNHIAVAIVSTEREKAVFIWEHLLEQLKKSRVLLPDRYSSAMLPIVNLSTCYGMMGRYQDCVRICLAGISLCCQKDRYISFSKLMGNYGETRIFLGDRKEDYRELFRQVYYLADLFQIKKEMKYYDRFYRENFDRDVEWY